MTENCIFCKIIKGQIPCTKVYEDTDVFVFLDINPINKGHTLVVPKHHSENLYTIPEKDLLACVKTCKKVAIALKEAVKAEGVNIGMNNDGAAGQAVFHSHFHVIPRFSHDGLKHWPGKKYEGKEAEEIAQKLKGSLL